MIDISIYKDKLNSALKQKKNQKYKPLITKELSKQEWSERLFKLEKLLSNIKNESDFKTYLEGLAKLFDDLYEVITAPGVDDFIAWINQVTNDKNNTDAQKLRDYLVDRYSDSNISESIESVNSNKSVLEIENSIFHSLLSDVKKELKNKTTRLLSVPDQFENNIDDYFETLTSTLEELNKVEELCYTSQEQLFTNEQKSENSAFYDNLVNAILDKGQSLKPKNEIEKSKALISKVQNRIAEIKEGISILYNSKVATSQDELLKDIFLKLAKEVNYDKGISNALKQFIDETWDEIESQYQRIKSFFGETIEISYDDRWDSFAKKGGIISLIDEYNKISKENPLINILKSSDDVAKQLKKIFRDYEKYFEQAKQLKPKIETEFKEKIEEFGSTEKKQLLENLSNNNPALLEIKEDIESNIEGLKGGITKLYESDNLIKFLKDDFTYVLNNLEDIRTGFETFLQQSGMSKHIEWLNKKLNDSKKGTITTQDFNEPELIKELLEKGLIKIEIEKNF